MRPGARRAALAIWGAGLVAVGCAVIAGVDDDRSLATAPDAGESCHTDVPPKPDVEVAGALDLTFAVHRIDFGEKPDAGAIGLDLDQHCTCQGEGPSCLPPKWKPDAGPYCDRPGGRDNAASAIFLGLKAAGLDSGGLTSNINQGDWSVLLRVRGYSGDTDDDRVSLAIYPTPGFPKGTFTPNWDGNDAWPILESSLGAPDGGMPSTDAPLYVDNDAYVAGGMLVANSFVVEGTTILLGTDTSKVEIRLTHPILVARLEKTGSEWRLENGLLTFRWKLDDVFLAASTVVINGARICKESFGYNDFFKTPVCANVDIHDELDDGEERCNSVSFAFGFEADPAKLGEILPQPDPEGTECPAGQDPIDDHCD